MDYSDDMDAMTRLGLGPDHMDQLARIGFAPGQFAQFLDFDAESRSLILRLLYQPTDLDWEEVNALPQGKELAQWLLALPSNGDAGDRQES